METYNSILDHENPAADLYRRHVEAQAYGCIACKHGEGSSFERIEIGDDNLISYKYNCRYCGNSTVRQFSLNEISMMMKMASRGDEIEFWEIWCMVKFYPSLINNPKKYKEFCSILTRPASFVAFPDDRKTRWTEAWEKLLGGRKCQMIL
jgi:hypothetical protein